MATNAGPIRVIHFGLGPIGAAVVRQVAERKGFKIVGAVDIDPAKVGRDLGEVTGLGRKLKVTVSDNAKKAIKASKPDVAEPGPARLFAARCSATARRVQLPGSGAEIRSVSLPVFPHKWIPQVKPSVRTTFPFRAAAAPISPAVSAYIRRFAPTSGPMVPLSEHSSMHPRAGNGASSETFPAMKLQPSCRRPD